MQTRITRAQTDGVLFTRPFVGEKNLDMARVLLEHGSKVNGEPADPVLPLGVAVRTGGLPMVELLFAHGAQVDEPDSTRLPPIFTAIRQGDTAAVRILLDEGTKTFSYGTYTIFHAAAEMRLSPMMRLFLEHVLKQKPDNFLELVNQLNDEGESPLHIAAQNGDLETVRALVEADASIDIKDALLVQPSKRLNGRLGAMIWHPRSYYKSFTRTSVGGIQVALTENGPLGCSTF